MHQSKAQKKKSTAKIHAYMMQLKAQLKGNPLC